MERNRHVDKTAIERQIEAADRQVDDLVYELYRLSDEEIKIVDESSRTKCMVTEVSWYNDPLFVGLVVVSLTLATGRLAGWLQGRARRREQAATLTIAFAAEMDTLVLNLEPVVREALASAEKGETYVMRNIVLPCAVYEANVSRIGDLGDKQLVRFLVGAYSHATGVRALLDRQHSDSGPASTPDLLASLVGAWTFAVSANSMLRQTARDTLPRPFDLTMSQEDADRLNVAVGFLNSVSRREAPHAPERESTSESVRERHPRAYERWSSEEDNRLRSEFGRGRSVKELARLFRRQPSAIRSRLNKLGLA